MRNRLVELVDKAKKEYASDVTDYTETDYIVECLLNEGVIVPPCKVGDEVYYIIDGKIQELLADYGTFGKIDFTMSARCKEEADMCEYSCSEGKTCGIGFGYSDIGKTVFLTREDAEAKLKGGATE